MSIRFQVVGPVVALLCLGVLACSGSSGGGPGGTGGTTVSCRQKASSDVDSDCEDKPGKPRKLDCSSSTETDEAIASGCSRTNEGDSDVCCPLTISGTSDGAPSGSKRLACRQKEDADGNAGCTVHEGKPRQLDCESEAETDEAIAAGCVREDEGDRDVCCSMTVRGTTDEGEDDTSGPIDGTCTTSYAGTWALGGSCGSKTCTVVQSGCSTSISCTDGTTLSGTISGSTAELSGKSGGTALTCTVTFAGTKSFALSCNLCDGSGSR